MCNSCTETSSSGKTRFTRHERCRSPPCERTQGAFTLQTLRAPHPDFVSVYTSRPRAGCVLCLLAALWWILSVVLVFVRLWFIKMYIRSVLRLWWKNISVILIPRLKTSRCNWYRPIFILRIYTMINCWYKDLRPHSVRSWCPVTQTKHSTALCWCETFLRSPSLSPPWRPQVFRGSGGLLQGG